MALTKITFTIQGTAPMLMHSAQLADPFNKYAKELSAVTSRRKKTEDDHKEAAKIEFLGGLYTDNGRVILPGDNVLRCLREGATKTRQGKDVIKAIPFIEDSPLVYDGPESIAELAENDNFIHRASVKVGMSRIMRTRPIFREWAAVATFTLDTDVMEVPNLARIADYAGAYVGLGDWRPRYGRFNALVEGN